MFKSKGFLHTLQIAVVFFLLTSIASTTLLRKASSREFAQRTITKDIVGNHFCVGTDGTEWNASGFNPFPLFGSAGLGNCMGQFRVRDW